MFIVMTNISSMDSMSSMQYLSNLLYYFVIANSCVINSFEKLTKLTKDFILKAEIS